MKGSKGFIIKKLLVIVCVLSFVCLLISCEKPRDEYGADYSSYVLRQVKATINDRVRGTGISTHSYEIEQISPTRYRGSYYVSYGGSSSLEHFEVETDGYGEGTGIRTY